MKKLLLTGLIPLSVLLAAPAHADDTNQYLNDVNAAGISSRTNDAALIQDGYKICAAVQGGIPPTAVAGILMANSHKTDDSTGITLDEARAWVGAAVRDLC